MKSEQQIAVNTVRVSGSMRRRQDQRRSGAGRRDVRTRPQIIDQSEAEQQYALGMANFKNSLFDRALKNFSQAANDPQQLVNCIIMGAHCHLKKGRLQKSLSLLQDGCALQGLCGVDKQSLLAELRKVEKVAAKFGKSPQVEELKLSPLAEWELTPIAEWEHSAIDEWEQSAMAQWDSYLEACPAQKTPLPAAADPVERPAERPAAQHATNSSPKDQLSPAHSAGWLTIPGYLLVAVVIYYGWLIRSDQLIIPEQGLGYQLGILGSLCMLALLLYPLRKKLSLMRNWGPTRYWFKAHMFLGILGPTLVLFHANFKLGSINSTVVLGCTLLVAGSGFFGRYLYTHVHYGLYGKRLTLEKLHQEISANRGQLAYVFVYAPKLKQRLLNFEASVFQPPHGVLQSIVRVFIIDLRKRWTYLLLQLGLRRALKVTARRNGWSRKKLRRQKKTDSSLISIHLTAVLKVAELSFYERLFSLWHLFHLPLFILLVIAGVVHVIAVHMY